ncbi:GreA/GreB family elongation factor [Actinokineospora sp. UTMC 2448]|uniref:GreA/GreB family elongation factor n=1 Tax=Actinokineospora sp. UTMC 2448 TaxID=2268449 RepID=UPI0021641D34|nr:GreA/GreB family elongation factor [Actinokineospora sp. UTMC 2448]UVS81141.1 Transcript cleavage factor GreA [Actinokineospora sp. UTMC 2448]
MTSTHRTWLTPEAHDRLRAELADLLTPPTATDDEHGTRHQRIREIRDLLNNAVVGEAPADDGIAEPGMVLTVRYDDTGETETFLLGVRHAEHGDLEVYSPDSPLGRALTGTRKGDQCEYQVPNGSTVKITLVDAVPYRQPTPQD